MRRAAVVLLPVILLSYAALRCRPRASAPASAGTPENRSAPSPAVVAAPAASPTERAVSFLPAIRLDALRGARSRRKAAEPPPPRP